VYITIFAFAIGLSLYGSSSLFGIIATEIAPPGFERRSYAVIELATQGSKTNIEYSNANHLLL
jgi:hypothetical protein